MSGYVLSERAEKDMLDIHEYIAASSPQNAARMIDRLLAAMERIGRDATVGHVRSDVVWLPLRTITVHPYQIFFDPVMRPVVIVAVLHGARDVPAALTNE